MNHIIDMRSDTTTQPTPSMWEAMSHAKVGDDVYGDDPTVNALEKKAAEMLGKEAALFVPSGTMGNLIAIMSHCARSEEAIIGSNCHIFWDEQGGISALAGVSPHTIPNQKDGTLRLEDIREAYHEEDIHFTVTRMVALENTMLEMGAVPLSVEYTASVGALAQELGLRLHIDGARLFNAAVAQGVPARELVAPADSVTFCLSKGLCAPAGSMLCGTGAFIHKARRARKQLGGGMRQIGILAAAGIVALDENIDRLAEDHHRMKTLAAGLETIPGLTITSYNPPPTNMVYFNINDGLPLDAIRLVDRLKDNGVLCLVSGERRIRFATHYYISDADVEQALAVLKNIMSAL